MGFIDSIKECFTSEELMNEPIFRAVLFGDGAAYFENVKTILHYDVEEIGLGLKKGKIVVRGQGLYVKKYCAGDVVICGKIKSVEKF
ncbi:MAG: YabP/YqfC family sporulation protein [Clostridia bacterium]|nr:YabP/YqfC family sporulation protein [Clostridia bacterium]